MPEFPEGAEALRLVERVIADRPKRDGATLRAAVHALAQSRDALAARRRVEGGALWRPALDCVNAAISVVLAVEFPIGEVRWAELDQARDWLDRIVAEASKL